MMQRIAPGIAGLPCAERNVGSPLAGGCTAPGLHWKKFVALVHESLFQSPLKDRVWDVSALRKNRDRGFCVV